MTKVLTRKMPRSQDEISILGYGCMRFPRKMGTIDMVASERQVRLAIENGVNYFDTAYVYPGNEKAIGDILAKGDLQGRLRERVFLATKLHLMMVKSQDDMDRIFNKSLERLQTNYIDYYLVHSLSSFSEWEKGKNMGIIEFLDFIKKSGKAKYVGFSWHGNLHDFRDIVDDYDWDFCQLQYNYLDEYHQAGLQGINYAEEKGLGVIVMEPLRGGTLADKKKIPKAALELMDSYTKDSGVNRSPAEWGLRYVWNHPAVTCLLSGMNDDAQVAENVETASSATPNALSTNELDMLGLVRDIFQKTIKVGCTGCSYCMPCPAGVNIPLCFSDYNNYSMFESNHVKLMHNFNLRGRVTIPSSYAINCKKCGVCEKKCPQNIKIVESLDAVAETLESPLYRAVAKIASIFIG